jgi:hypothetical protein
MFFCVATPRMGVGLDGVLFREQAEGIPAPWVHRAPAAKKRRITMTRFAASVAAVLIVTGTCTPLAQAGRPQRDDAQLLDAWYRHFLGRPADAEAFRAWLGQMRQGNYLAVEAGILGSDEYFMRNGNTPEGMIIGFYTDVLNRRPSQDEVRTWMSRLRQIGWDRTALATDFLNAAQAELALRNGLPPVYQPTYIPPQRVVGPSWQYSGPLWGYWSRNYNMSGPLWGYFNRPRDHRDRGQGQWTPWSWR